MPDTLTAQIARPSLVLRLGYDPVLQKRALSRHTAKALKLAIVGASIATDNPHVALDCRDAQYVDSTAIGALITARRKLHECGGSLTLIGLNEDIREVFVITKIAVLFTIVTEDAWLAAGMQL